VRAPRILCAACEAEIVTGRLPDGTETGTCPDCGLSERLEVIEDEIEEVLMRHAARSQRRLDPDTPGGAPEPPPRGRFTVRL